MVRIALRPTHRFVCDPCRWIRRIVKAWVALRPIRPLARKCLSRRDADRGVVHPRRAAYTCFSLLDVEQEPAVTVGPGRRPMRFHLIDRIETWESGKSLRAAKFLALGEEYLADHFPRFPVMPGVLMLQTVVEAASWLWRATSEFRHPVIVLRDVKNVKYGTFMQPGHRMDVVVDLVKCDADSAIFKGKGTNDGGQQTISVQFTLRGYGLAERGPAGAAADEQLLRHWKSRWALLTGALKPKTA